MATVDVINTRGDKVSTVELSEGVFSVPVKNAVLHQVVTAQLAARRAGTATVKNRGDVTGSTHKLYRQKGTGRARKGDIKSPLLRGGGVIFGPHPRSYSKKVPKKLRKLALKMALSSKLQSDELLVLNDFNMDQPKTKVFADTMKTLSSTNALIITAEGNATLTLSSRNIPGTKVLSCDGLNVYDILKYEKLVLLEGAIKKIEGRLLS